MKKIKLYDYQQVMLRKIVETLTSDKGRGMFFDKTGRKVKLDCLVNVNLFDEGFDCPDVEYIQMTRPTLSLAKYMQMVGRGLRINHENRKKVCMIIDNVGNEKWGLRVSTEDVILPPVYLYIKTGTLAER